MTGSPKEILKPREHGFTESIRHGSRAALVRDFLIFQVKLFLDGLKDVVVSPLAFIALVWDLVSGRGGRRHRRGRRFYSVLRMTERFDLWLNLYGAARRSERSGEGLFEESAAGSDTLLGRLEELALEATTQGSTELRRRLAEQVRRSCGDPAVGVGNFVLARNAFRVVRRRGEEFELLVEIPAKWLKEERWEEVDAALAPFGRKGAAG